MKLYETILFALTIGLLVIGLHQTMVNGFANSYWIFMLMLILMMVYGIRKNRLMEKEEKEKQIGGQKKISGKAKRTEKKK